ASVRRIRTRSPPGSTTSWEDLPKVTNSQVTSRASARASSSGYLSPPPNSPSRPNEVGATWMIRMLSVSLITLGDPGQLTGGYLYHRRMAEAASAHDARLRFVSFPALPFPLPAARAGVVLQRACSPADVVVLDSIAAAFLAPLLVLRRSAIPLVAILHQPPGGIDHNALRTWLQAALDRLVYRQAAALVLASAALAPELPADLRARAVVVPPGRDAGPPAAVADDLRCGRRAALLYVGNWVPRKGLLELLAAVAALPPDAATLHLAGRHDIDRRYAARVHARLAAPELAG